MAYFPQIKGLRVTEIFTEARKYIEIDDYMPEMKDDKLPNRDYVVNVDKQKLTMTIISEHLIPINCRG